jgi:hypothetical protein
MTLVGAGQMIGRSDRQLRRLLWRYETEGAVRPVSRKRGSASNNRQAPSCSKRPCGSSEKDTPTSGRLSPTRTLCEIHQIRSDT